MSGAQHTPTPWFLRNEDVYPDLPEGWLLEGANGKAIAEFPRLVPEAKATQIADARRIVQCVNAHDELVAALDAIWLHTHISSKVDAGIRRMPPALREAILASRAAIAKATGSAA